MNCSSFVELSGSSSRFSPSLIVVCFFFSEQQQTIRSAHMLCRSICPLLVALNAVDRPINFGVDGVLYPGQTSNDNNNEMLYRNTIEQSTTEQN